MKTLKELLSCVEDDIELMGENHIIYLKEENDTIVDYDYLPSEDYFEAVTLKDLMADLSMRSFAKELCDIVEGGKRKLAVIFPGIGYTCDKPLLYYSSHMAAEKGYEVKTVNYGDFSEKIKEGAEKKTEVFEFAKYQVEEQLKDISWNHFDEIVFISKSMGTVLSSWYSMEHNISVKSILFTPLHETYSFISLPAVAFHGSADPWANTKEIERVSKEKGIPLYITENANHSLEVGDIEHDLDILRGIMRKLKFLF